MSKISDVVTKIAQPIVAENGCELWDVEYVREAGQWYLRVYIDKPEGICIDDCEKISRALDPVLDEKDPIVDSYIFEVSSAGLERSLKKPEHFARFIGETVEVKLYTQYEGSKLYSGALKSFEKGAVTIAQGDGEITFAKEQIAVVHVNLL